MKIRRSSVLFLSLLGLAAPAGAESPPALVAADSESVPATFADLPKQPLTAQIIYQLLLAELAGNRGNLQLSLGAYLDLAKTTRDPRIAKRAVEVALYARQQEAALAAARLWVDIEPASPLSRQMLVSLMIAGNSTDTLAAEIAQMLALEKDDIGPALLRLSRMLSRLPDHQAVLQLTEQITTPYLKIAEAHFIRAHAAQAAGDDARALAEIRRARELRPDWEPAVIFEAQMVRKNPEEAAEVLRRFVAAHPQAREARLAYARSLVGAKRYEAARAEFRALLEGNRDDADVVYAVAILSLQLNDRAQAETQFKRLLEMDYPESNNIRLQLGQLAEDDKRWEEAIRWYREVAPGEQYLTARSRAASVMAQHGRLDEGRGLLQEAAAADPHDQVQFLVAEAVLLRDAGRAEEAYALLDGGLAKEPEQTDLLYETALLADRLGKIDVLERNLRKVIELKPDYAHAYNALGYSLADRNLRLDEAQQLIDKALALAPDDPFILDSKGWVLFRRGDKPAALDVLQHAFALRADPEIAAHMGEVLWTMGRRSEAEQTWKDAAKANPGNEALTATIKKFLP